MNTPQYYCLQSNYNNAINNSINPNDNDNNNNNDPNNMIIDPSSIDVLQIEKLLINEKYNCSTQDRNDIQEEIHGVHSMAAVETPELLERSLKLLEIELNNDIHIPRSDKRAYLLSQQLQYDMKMEMEMEMEYEQEMDQEQEQEQQEQMHGDNDNDDDPRPSQNRAQKEKGKGKENENENENEKVLLLYVNTNEFRLMYLRCDFFNVQKAALRIVQALDFLLENYGEYALKRKIQLSDFTSDQELAVLKKGMIQLLPSRDRGGRRIILSFFFNEFGNVPYHILVSLI
jgi:hypothetical protein